MYKLECFILRFDFTPTPEEMEEIVNIFKDSSKLRVPDNFSATSPIYSPGDTPKTAFPISNPQTQEFCEKLGVTDPLQNILDKPTGNPLLNTSYERSGRYSSYSSLVPSQLDITMNHSSMFVEVSN